MILLQSAGTRRDWASWCKSIEGIGGWGLDIGATAVSKVGSESLRQGRGTIQGKSFAKW